MATTNKKVHRILTQTFTDTCLLSAEQQVLLHEGNFLQNCKCGNLTRTQAALNRDYERRALSTMKYIELSRRLHAIATQ